MLILNKPSAKAGRVFHNLAMMRPHARFVDDIAPTLWDVALTYGLDPVVVIAQSGKETSWGHYGRAVLPSLHSTAGIKIYDPKLAGPDTEVTMAHAQFASWGIGAHAHCQHLLAYLQMTWDGSFPLVDPRWVHVYGKKTAIRDVEQLGGPGSWAPSPTYGQEIVGICNRLSDRSVVMP